jgi:hypothetical protein
MKLKYIADFGSKPGDVILVQAVTGCGSFNGALYQASLAQHLEMLGHRRLGYGQVVYDVPGDAAGVNDQEFHNLEPDRVTECLEHGDKVFLFLSGDIKGAAGLLSTDVFYFRHHPVPFIVNLR